jgi:hypothetical protein
MLMILIMLLHTSLRSGLVLCHPPRAIAHIIRSRNAMHSVTVIWFLSRSPEIVGVVHWPITGQLVTFALIECHFCEMILRN